MAKRGRILALVTTKGGAGKTTLAASIAGELLKRGETVTLVDADPQGSGGLSQWHGAGGTLAAAELRIEPRETAAQVAREAAQRGVVIVDVGGAFTKTTVAVLAAADVVLVPARPSALDATRAAEVVQATREATRATVAVVLNGCTRSALPAHIRAELKAAGVKVLRSEIGSRVAFQTAMLYGTAPAAMGSVAAKAAGEIEALVNEIGRL